MAGNPSTSSRHIILQATVGMSSHLLMFSYSFTHAQEKLKSFIVYPGPSQPGFNPFFQHLHFTAHPHSTSSQASPLKTFFIWQLPQAMFILCSLPNILAHHYYPFVFTLTSRMISEDLKTFNTSVPMASPPADVCLSAWT